MFEALSEGELLQFVAPNLCGFFPGLEAVSILAITSNLVAPFVKPKLENQLAIISTFLTASACHRSPIHSYVVLI